MVKTSEIAVGVRVVLNDNWKEKCLGDRYLKDEKVLYIQDERHYNDTRGNYVMISGGSHTNSGRVYLDEIDLEFDWREVLPQKEAYKVGTPMWKGAQEE